MSDETQTTITDEHGVFTRCDGCDRIKMTGTAHRCEARGWKTNTADEREKRRELDDIGEPDDEVIIAIAKRSCSARAYHVEGTGDDGEPNGLPDDLRCSSGRRDPDRWRKVTREQARERRMFPCAYCHGFSKQQGPNA